MGGRGGKSGFQTRSSVLTDPMKMTDFQSLHDFMRNTYNIELGKSMQQLDIKSVQHVARAVSEIADEFPQAVSSIRKIRVHKCSTAGAAAEASLDGTINLSDYYKNWHKLKREYGIGVKQGFHPPTKNAAESVVAHETGHLIEAALIRKATAQMGKSRRYMSIVMWNNSTEAKRIISQACKDVKTTPAGKGRKNAELRREVSGYSMRNHSENLAECVADYAANGSNAKPLSQAVWKLLKKELG